MEYTSTTGARGGIFRQGGGEVKERSIQRCDYGNLGAKTGEAVGGGGGVTKGVKSGGTLIGGMGKGERSRGE